jgi:hypothetical protein
MKRYNVTVTYAGYDKNDLDASIEKSLRKVAKSKTTDENTGNRVLVFDYATRNEAKVARFLSKKVPRDTVMTIEYEK